MSPTDKVQTPRGTTTKQQYHRQQLPPVAAGYGKPVRRRHFSSSKGAGGGEGSGRGRRRCDSPVRFPNPPRRQCHRNFIQQKGHHPHTFAPPRPGTGPRGLLFPLKKRFVFFCPVLQVLPLMERGRRLVSC
ncbi:hypothetical protein niasHT_036847 [Heterodera trifolii]|uniref:Uncharacterized protein n=1 Tax=Heterodera trifolii TaxID=157864 RepID=A0ABD2I0Y5_9BILA